MRRDTSEVDRGAGELGAGEDDQAAGEPGAAEADPAAGEPGAAEDDRAAGELGAAEVTAVKDDAREVEVQALPRLPGLRRRASLEVRGDDPNDGVTHLPVRQISGPLSRISIVARVRVVGQAQVAAENIDAGLPVLFPVFSQARHGIHPRQPDSRWLIIA
jgi:hypothetical protein